MADPYQQTWEQITALAVAPGWYELRALERVPGERNSVPRGSYWIPVTATDGKRRIDKIPQALAWARNHAQKKRDVYIGANPRSHERGRSKADVIHVTACYTDLDLGGQRMEEALAALKSCPAPPTIVVHSGRGLHPFWVLRAPAADKRLWVKVQRGIFVHFASFAADPLVVTDEARILRLVPFPNHKDLDKPLPTSIAWQSDERYKLEELAEALPLGSDANDPIPIRMPEHAPVVLAHDGGVPDFDAVTPVYGREHDGEPADLPASPASDTAVDELGRALDGAEKRRGLIIRYVARNFKLGVDYGSFPSPHGGETKPTLLKAGAEKLTLLFGWRAVFAPDRDTLAMAGGHAGTFAYVCYLVDRGGRIVGQGPGATELRERPTWTVNVAVKIAQKRALVAAVLLTACVSDLFTENLSDELAEVAGEQNGAVRPPADVETIDLADKAEQPSRDRQATEVQLQQIRKLARRAGVTEESLCEQLEIEKLEELSRMKALRVAERLINQVATFN